MTATPDAPLSGHPNVEDEAKSLQAFAAAVTSDLDLFADLHDREPTVAVVDALQRARIEEQLGLVLKSEPSLSALAAFALAVDELPRPAGAAALNELAAGYADVYLRYSYRASPEESVWLTEDGLQRQAPMFEVREWYARNNLRATDYAGRPDDHIVLELRFLARMFAGARTPEDLGEPARFLDAHLLRWVKRFAIRLVQAGAPNWYAALVLLTASYIDELRDHLSVAAGIARPEPEAPKSKSRQGAATEALDGESAAPYLPGVAPSW